MSASPHTPVTLKTIAAVAGVSNPTVSRALRNDPRISDATRARIRAIADRLRYRPDPAMAALVAYRQRIQSPGDYGKLAILNAWETTADQLGFYIQEQLIGVREQAAQMGYQTEMFGVPKEPEAQKRLSRTLAARGIRGILVGPLPVHRSKLHLDWSSFSVVALGYSLTEPALNYVANNHRLTLDTLYSQLRELGYRKIGFFDHIQSEQRNQHIYLATYLKCQLLDGISSDSAPALLQRRKNETGPIEWLDRYQFDAVICGYFESQYLINELTKAGRKVPEDLGVAAIGIPPDDEATSGVRENLSQIGSLAVQQLHSQLTQGLLGVPARRHSVLVESCWCNGKTVRRRATARNREE